MKTIALIKKASLLIVLAAMSAGAVNAQKSNDKTAAIKQLVESQNYIFIAQSAMPMGGRTRQLTPDYDFKITKTAITASLPYFGRAYSAPMDPTQGGINFSTTSFNYTATPRKKGGWDISIKPADAKDVQQLFLSITETGYATLQVTSTNRQAISFSGYIDAIKEKKNK
jgi:hypothetical protein